MKERGGLRLAPNPMNLKDKLKLSTRPGVTTTLEPEGDRVHITNEYEIPNQWVSQNEEKLAACSGRAPLGDSHGAWQLAFNAPIPLSLINKYVPMDAWNDEKAWAKLINSADYRRFRSGKRF